MLTKTLPVTDVETHARIPDRARIVNPDTLSEYVQKMEAHLAKQADWIKEWVEWKNPPLQEMMRNEIYALMDSLTSLLVMAEKAGYVEMVEEILWTGNALEQAAAMAGPRNNKAWCEMVIRDELWGQEPPPMSEHLKAFAFLREKIGVNIMRAMDDERNGIV